MEPGVKDGWASYRREPRARGSAPPAARSESTPTRLRAGEGRASGGAPELRLVAASWPRAAVIIDPDPECRACLRQVLAARAGMIAEAATAEDGLGAVARVDPGLVLVGVEDPEAALELAARLFDLDPTRPIALCGTGAGPEFLLRAMRAGVREVVARPPDPVELEAAIGRLGRHRAPAGEAKPARGQIIAVFAAKGGLGATFVATNLAILMAGGMRTAIVDLNFGLGDVDTFLNLKAGPALDAGSGDLDAGAIEAALVRHRSGLRVLAPPAAPAAATPPGEVARLLERLQARFDRIVVDAARRLDEPTRAALDLAEHILLVTALDLPTIRNTRRSIEICTQLGYRERLRLVLNRHRPARMSDRLEGAFGIPVFWRLPDDDTTASAAVNAGVPVADVGPSTELAASLSGLAALFLGPGVAGRDPAARRGLLRRLMAAT